MRIMPIFSVLRGVDRAVVFIACSVLVASRLVVELLVLHVQVYLRAVGFCVSRALLLRSLLCHASPFFRAVVFRRFVYSTPLPGQHLTRRSRGTRPEAGEPLNSTLASLI